MLRAIIGYPTKWLGFSGMAVSLLATVAIGHDNGFEFTPAMEDALIAFGVLLVMSYLIFRLGKWIANKPVAEKPEAEKKKPKSSKYDPKAIRWAIGSIIWTILFAPVLPTLLGLTDNIFANFVGHHGEGWVVFGAFIGMLATPVPALIGLIFLIYILSGGKFMKEFFERRACQHCGEYELVDTGKVDWEDQYTSGDYHVKKGKDYWGCNACGELSMFDYEENKLTAEAQRRKNAEYHIKQAESLTIEASRTNDYNRASRLRAEAETHRLRAMTQ